MESRINHHYDSSPVAPTSPSTQPQVPPPLSPPSCGGFLDHIRDNISHSLPSSSDCTPLQSFGDNDMLFSWSRLQGEPPAGWTSSTGSSLPRKNIEEHNQNGLAPRQPPAADRGKKPNPRKRTRASKKAPTTVFTTDTSNFRAMVQEFTGLAASPFSRLPQNASYPFRPALYNPNTSSEMGLLFTQIQAHQQNLIGRNGGSSGLGVEPSAGIGLPVSHCLQGVDDQANVRGSS